MAVNCCCCFSFFFLFLLFLAQYRGSIWAMEKKKQKRKNTPTPFIFVVLHFLRCINWLTKTKLLVYFSWVEVFLGAPAWESGLDSCVCVLCTLFMRYELACESTHIRTTLYFHHLCNDSKSTWISDESGLFSFNCYYFFLLFSVIFGMTEHEKTEPNERKMAGEAIRLQWNLRSIIITPHYCYPHIICFCVFVDSLIVWKCLFSWTFSVLF